MFSTKIRASEFASVVPASGEHVGKQSLAVEATVAELGRTNLFFGQDAPATGSNSGAVVGESPRARSSSGQSTGLRNLTHGVGDGLNGRTALAPGSRAAVRRYARMNPRVGLDDLEQEAALYALEAAQGWRPDGTASRDWHEARIVALALSRLVVEARCPVSLPKHCGAKGACNGKDGTRDRWADAAEAGRAPLTWSGEDGNESENPALAHVAAEQFEPSEVILDRERAHAEIRRILDAQSEAARAVLLEEEKSAEVARRMGMSVREVYDATAKAMAALRAAFARQVAA